MPTIKPFKAVRATRDKVALVSSKSYEVYSDDELKAKLDFNPFSFLHVINPGYKYHQDLLGENKFELVHNRFLEFLENNIFLKDLNPAFYIYEKTSAESAFCGIIAGTSVEDYKNNLIKKHEGTISKRELLFENYLKSTGFNAEPVLLTYPDNKAVEVLINKYRENQRPEYEFSTTDKKLHKLWIVDNENDIIKFQECFSKMEKLYIADGHHRSSSSCLLAESLAKENPNHTGKEDYNYFMSYLIPESNLKISEFNRFVKDLNGFTKDEFLIRLDEYYRIENRGQHFYQPSKKHHFSMYLDGEFYSLYLRNTLQKFDNALSKLDSEILYQTILKPILNIQDLNNDDRIGYANTKKDILSIKTNVDNGKFKLGFGMVPITIKELKEIADADLKMPPKSTYIEPKLRSGLTIYEF